MFFHSLILLLPISCVSTSQLVPKKICDKKRDDSVLIPYSPSSLPNIFRSPCSVKLGNIPPSHLDFSKLHDDNETSEEEEEASLFNTFQIGYSKPISDKWSFVIEVAPVMEGFKLKSPNGFLDTAPIIVTVGLSCSF